MEFGRIYIYKSSQTTKTVHSSTEVLFLQVKHWIMKSGQLLYTLGIFTLDIRLNWLELHSNSRTSCL